MIDGVAIVCLHGPESTGKSTLGEKLAAHYACPFVPEYGRAYCEVHGNDISMAELVHIAVTHDSFIREQAASAEARAAGLVISDTDALVTAIWADMMFGYRAPWFAAFDSYADLYLNMANDLPFMPDGQRVYEHSADRDRFFALCEKELVDRGVTWAEVGGTGDARFDAAVAAIDAHFPLSDRSQAR